MSNNICLIKKETWLTRLITYQVNFLFYFLSYFIFLFFCKLMQSYIITMATLN